MRIARRRRPGQALSPPEVRPRCSGSWCRGRRRGARRAARRWSRWPSCSPPRSGRRSSSTASNRFFVAVAEDGRLGRLLPLYFVLAAAGLALGWRALRGRASARCRECWRCPPRPSSRFAFAVAAVGRRPRGRARTCSLFFTLPFAALLARGGARADTRDWVPARAGAIARSGWRRVFAAVGLWQAATHELFFYAPNLEVSNANTDYFRVTSLFGDPSLYGRHVVLGIGVVLALLATPRLDLGCSACSALLWAGAVLLLLAVEHGRALLVTLARRVRDRRRAGPAGGRRCWRWGPLLVGARLRRGKGDRRRVAQAASRATARSGSRTPPG